eukprot:51838-Rhodomonas_salina.2
MKTPKDQDSYPGTHPGRFLSAQVPTWYSYTGTWGTRVPRVSKKNSLAQWQGRVLLFFSLAASLTTCCYNVGNLLMLLIVLTKTVLLKTNTTSSLRNIIAKRCKDY